MSHLHEPTDAAILAKFNAYEAENSIPDAISLTALAMGVTEDRVREVVRWDATGAC